MSSSNYRPHPIKGSKSIIDSASQVTTVDNVTMAATFLQYCAMCEKQIMHPSPAILYCSEACHRKDDAKPLSASILPASNMSASAPVTRATSPIRSGPSSPYGSPPVLRIPSDLHDHKSDLDPTEWKPKLGGRTNSEAYRYLAQFHAAMTASENGEYVKADRHRYGRHKSTLSMTINTTPSLGNTPTTVSSSFDSMYEFSTRPLLPRHNPMYALSAGAKSDELVTPHVAPPVSIAVSVAEDATKFDWSKKIVVKEASGGRDGLGALFKAK